MQYLSSNYKRNYSISIIFLYTVPPRSLTISSDGETFSNSSSVTVIETIDREFTCLADGATPPADLNWKFDGQPTDPDKDNEETPDTIDSRLTDTTSNKTISPVWSSHHGKYLQCESIQGSILPPEVTSVIFDVKGNHAVLSCISDS